MNGRVLCVHTPYCVCTHNIAVIHEKLWHTHTYVYIDTYINGHVLCVHTPYCVCTHNIAVMQETLSSYLRKFITSEIPFFFFSGHGHGVAHRSTSPSARASSWVCDMTHPYPRDMTCHDSHLWHSLHVWRLLLNMTNSLELIITNGRFPVPPLILSSTIAPM